MLIWLALPLTALLLLRADYERYEHELASQLKYAQSRKELLLRYSSQYDNRGREVLAISDPQARILWEKRFKEIGQHLASEEAQLGSASLSHYPQLSDLFERATKELEQQRDNLNDAARLQDAFAKSQGSLDDLRMEYEDLYWQAEMYRQIGAIDVFYHIHGLLSQLKQQLNRRDRRRFELTNELTLAMSQANSHRSELRRLLASMPDQLAIDQGRSYREDLAQRFASFDLVGTVKRLVTGPQPARAASGN